MVTVVAEAALQAANSAANPVTQRIVHLAPNGYLR
jgi:hypothetical protein